MQSAQLIITAMLLSYGAFHSKYFKRARNLSYLLSIVYAVSSLLNLLWFFKVNDPKPFELHMLSSAFLVAITTINVIIVSVLIKKRMLLLLVSIYVFSSLAFQLSYREVFVLIEFISFLILFIAGVSLSQSRSKNLVNGAYLLSLYSALSLVYSAAESFTDLPLANVSLLLTMILLLYYYFLIMYLKNVHIDPNFDTKELPFMKMLRVLFSITALLMFIALSVMSVHELGHAIVSNLVSCEKTQAIIYDEGIFPQTQMICPPGPAMVFVALAGMIFPTVIGIIMLMSKEIFLIAMSYLVIGFSFYFSNDDFMMLGLPKNFLLMLGAISLIFLYLGIKDTISQLSFHQFKK